MEVTSKFGHTALNIDIKQNHHGASLEGFDSPPTWGFFFGSSIWFLVLPID